MFRPLLAAATAALVISAAGAAQADEGMWPFDAAPVAQVKDALGVTLDSRWLEHLRGASSKGHIPSSASAG